MTPVRVVLDTNCLVSALIFSHGKAGQLRAAWQRGDIVPIVCRETVTEFKLEQEDIEKLLADILPWAETVAINNRHNVAELLRDKDDAVFIHLAQASGAAFLVSGDKHLLELRGIYPELHVVSLVEFMERVGITS